MPTRLIARQPILNRNQHLWAYELLFRDGVENYFRSDEDGDAASRDVADNLLTSGPGLLTAGYLAFINCTRDFLVKDYATLLPKQQTAIEVIETIEPDDEVISALRRLKEAGYLIVLDDFVFDERCQPFIDLAELIKIDFLATPAEVRKSLPARFARRGIRFLAEKVETHEDFEEALRAGYSYFQGYFFCRPQIVTGTSIPAWKLHYLQLLSAVTQPEVDMREVERVIRTDLSLAYKLLRLVNSALFGLVSEVRSVRHALALIGERELVKWASVSALLTAAEDKPHELMRTSLLRARCCELLAPLVGRPSRGSEFFLMGLFSLMDALLGRPMAELLPQIALPDEIRHALSGEEGLPRRLCQLVEAYERADWASVNDHTARLDLSEQAFFAIYLESAGWTQTVLGAAEPAPKRSVGQAKFGA